MDDEQPDTPRVCEACGGGDGLGCAHCTEGFQSNVQYAQWLTWRRRMRHISASYDFLEDTCSHTISELRMLDEPDAYRRADVGQRLLGGWRSADPAADGRQASAEALTAWQREAISYLRSRRSRAQ